MNEKRLVKTSKYLSRHLRHAPEDIGLQLEAGGWVSVDDLLAACAAHGMRISREGLNEVVSKNDKKRFSFDETGKRIRANQGHSVEVDLQLQPAEPPPVLYHGTAEHNKAAILRDGLVRMRRHHVHLSGDIETAKRVGMRHGKPVIFVIDTAAVRAAGFLFYRSDNGVWLVDNVPAEYMCQLS